MKKFVSLLFIVGIMASTNAQDFAQNHYEDLLEKTFVMPFENSSATVYFLAAHEKSLYKWVTNMQREIAEYTFVTTDEHDKNEIYKVLLVVL